MIFYKLIVTLPADFIDAPAGLFVNAFHRWIQEQSIADHLPIDVADYAHVPDGPGTLLVCSEANIHVDSEGLMYVRKRAFDGVNTPEQGVARSVRTAIDLADKLESDPAITGHFKRRTGELRIRFNDRLATPNTPETAAAMTPVVVAAVQSLYPNSAVMVTRVDQSPMELLELRVTIGGPRG